LQLATFREYNIVAVTLDDLIYLMVHNLLYTLASQPSFVQEQLVYLKNAVCVHLKSLCKFGLNSVSNFEKKSNRY